MRRVTAGDHEALERKRGTARLLRQLPRCVVTYVTACGDLMAVAPLHPFRDHDAAHRASPGGASLARGAARQRRCARSAMLSDRLVSVLLVRGDDLARRALYLALDDHPRLTVLGAVASTDEAVRATEALVPDVVVLAPRLPDAAAVETCRAIKARSPDARVVVLAASVQREAEQALRRSGAAGLVLMSLDPLPLYAAVLAAAAGVVLPLLA
jgi:CheY-like chemotaxis protein